MAETSHEIRRQIAATRRQLGLTVAALENKMDPRRVVDEHPLALVGVAFGTGLLLATTGSPARAAQEVRDQVQNGATRINRRAGTALDGVLHAVMTATTSAIASKLNAVIETAIRKPESGRGQLRGSGSGSRAA